LEGLRKAIMFSGLQGCLVSSAISEGSTAVTLPLHLPLLTTCTLPQ
jgi:hypothetical protein